MKANAAMRVVMLGVAAAALCGCASHPISKDLRKQAKPLTLAQVTSAPDTSRGTVVIWGGRVIKTVNDTNGGTIYVLQMPMAERERPEAYGVSQGRFIARSRNFIDPEVFKNGQLITVAGDIAGTVTEPLQNTQFTYPVVNIRELHLWHLVRSTYYYPPAWYGGWYGPGWYGGWYGPAWGWGGYPVEEYYWEWR